VAWPGGSLQPPPQKKSSPRGQLPPLPPSYATVGRNVWFLVALIAWYFSGFTIFFGGEGAFTVC